MFKYTCKPLTNKVFLRICIVNVLINVENDYVNKNVIEFNVPLTNCIFLFTWFSTITDSICISDLTKQKA